MHFSSVVTGIALLTLSSITVAAWESTILPRTFSHENSLEKALVRATSEGKNVIVYYTRTKCPPCDVLRGRLNREEVGKQFQQNYVFTAVWGSSMGHEERESYRSRFGVRGAPTWIVYSAKGKYVCTARGGFESDEGGAALHLAAQAALKESSTNEANEVRMCQ